MNDMERSIKIIKNRSDIGAGTRGSDLGIDAMEIAAINKGSDFFRRYTSVEVPTRNDAVYENDVSPHGKHIKQIGEQCEEVASMVENSLKDNEFPLVFSGDHSSAIGTISGIKSVFPDKVLGVVWIDAHADIHSPYTTPSGYLHGMPLAAVLNEDNLDCQINEIDEVTCSDWEKLKKIGGPSAKIKAEHLIYFGVRDIEEQEDFLINKRAIRKFEVEEVRRRGVGEVARETGDRLAACDMLYISFDVDSMDSELISDGTGTPVPRGFVPSEVTLLLQEFVRMGKLVCIEIVEVNPLLDKQGNKMAEVTFDILEQVVRMIEENYL